MFFRLDFLFPTTFSRDFYAIFMLLSDANVRNKKKKSRENEGVRKYLRGCVRLRGTLIEIEDEICRYLNYFLAEFSIYSNLFLI